MKFVAAFVVLIMVGLATVSCQPAATNLANASTPHPREPLPASSVTPVGCSLPEILRQVDDLLSGETYQAHALTVNGKLTLSIWLVVSEIASGSQGGRIDKNNHVALQRGIGVAQQVVSHIPCARKTFVYVNPMIVDQRYNTWYLDLLPVDALLQGKDFGEGTEFAFQRSVPPGDFPPSTQDNCTWQQARSAIQSDFGADRRNAAAYLLIGYPAASQSPWDEAVSNRNVVVEVQWDVHSFEELDDQAILKNLERLSISISCMWPPVDRLEAFIVDEQGTLVVYAMLPGELLRDKIIPLPQDQVLLHHVGQPDNP